MVGMRPEENLNERFNILTVNGLGRDAQEELLDFFKKADKLGKVSSRTKE